ncbi:putative reverse transcriptase domain-containing protein, partial [Tanacetum coccineum]
SACTINFEGNWDTHLPLVEFPYNNSYHPSVNCAPFESIIWKEVSPRKGVGPVEVVKRVGPSAYRLRLPQELVDIHDIFHVSNSKKCLTNVNLHVPLEEIKIDDKPRFVEETVEIMDREVKKLKRSWIFIVKVRWNSRRGPELTWEREDEMKCK